MGEEGKNEGFDKVYDLVGGHGRFQWRLLLILSLQLIIVTWHHIGYTFLGAVPDHWCLNEELKETNWTAEQIKLISIPKIRKDINDEDSEYVYDKCNQYYFNYASLAATSNSFEEAYSKIDYSNATIVGCVKWDYDRSIYKSTIPSDFDLVCKQRWKTATIQSSYMAGGLVGTLFFGAVSDKFLGRRKTVLISMSMVAVAGIAAAFAKSYWMFLSLRFIISIGVSGSLQNCFVMIMEHTDIQGRGLFGMLEQIPFAIGYCVLPVLAYFIRDWSYLQFTFGITSLSVICYKWILPESPRWLATHGKEDEAVEFLLKMAKVNKMPEPSKEELLEIIRPCHQHHNIPGTEDNSSEASETLEGEATFSQKFKQRLKGVVKNFKNLMRTAEIRKRSLVFWTLFLTVALVYYGLVFSSNLTSDPFLLTFLLGLMEIPAYTVIVPFVTKLGRRPTTSATFILTGVFLITLSQIPANYEACRIVLAMAAKLFISSAFAIIYVLGAELYPTQMRTTGLAVGIFMGRMGAITAPYIADLMQYVGKDFPAMIFGITAVIAGLVSLGLPETGALEMTDQLHEVEKQAANERLKEKRHSWIDAI